jgi:hypothetical protein
VKDAQPNLCFGLRCKRCRFHGAILSQNGAILQADGESGT